MDLKDLKVLVIDDHHLIRQMVSTILKKHGLGCVETVTDGDVGVAAIKKAASEGKPFDIVFLDWAMPGLDGLEALKQCRADRELDRTAFIMLTAESEDMNIVKTLEAGATAYITKPFTPEALIKKIQDISIWMANKARP